MAHIEETIKDGEAIYNALKGSATMRIVVESMKEDLKTVSNPKHKKALRKVHNYYCFPKEKLPKDK